MALAALLNPRQHQTQRETTFKATFPVTLTGDWQCCVVSPFTLGFALPKGDAVPASRPVTAASV